MPAGTSADGASPRAAALAWVEGQTSRGPNRSLGSGAEAREKRLRVLLSSLEGEHQIRPALRKLGDRYPVAKLSPAVKTRTYQLVAVVEGGMVQAIPGGNAKGWLPTTTLKLESRTRSSQEQYFENRRPASARHGDARSTRSKPCTHSASARQVHFAQGASTSSAVADAGGKKPRPELHLPSIGKLIASAGKAIGDCEHATVDASKGIGKAAVHAGKPLSQLLKHDAAVAWEKIRGASAVLHEKEKAMEKHMHVPMSLKEMMGHMERHAQPLSPEEMQEMAAAQAQKANAGKTMSTHKTSEVHKSGKAPANGGAAPAKPDPAAPPTCNLRHVSERGRSDASSQGGYFAGYSFAGYVETLGIKEFNLPVSNLELQRRKEARARAREAKREKARQEAEDAARLLEATRDETPGERKKRLEREANVKQMMFNMDQQNASRLFLRVYPRLALLDVLVAFTYSLYLIYVFPEGDQITNDEGEVTVPSRSWFPYTNVTFATLAVLGSTLNFVSILAVRIVLGLKGVKSTSLPPVIKATTYTLYLGVWITFQSSISGVRNTAKYLQRLNDIMPISTTTSALAGVGTLMTILLTPMQFFQITMSYSMMYKGFLPMISMDQLGKHLNNSVQQSMTMSATLLFWFTTIFMEKQAVVKDPTIFGYLYRFIYAIATMGLLIAIFYGRVTTFARRMEISREKAEEDKENLTHSLTTDISVDQQVLLKGFVGKKEQWNGTRVLIMENIQAEDKLRVKVLQTDVKKLEDEELTVRVANVEKNQSEVQRKKEEEHVKNERLLIDFRLLLAEERLVSFETIYLVLCQITDALMVAEIIASYLLVDVAAISMYDDMVTQGLDEARRASEQSNTCTQNGGSEACTNIQSMLCVEWKSCSDDVDSGGAPEQCSPGCLISDSIAAESLSGGSIQVMLIAAVSAGAAIGFCCGSIIGRCAFGSFKACLGIGCGCLFVTALVGLAAVFYFYIYLEGTLYEHCETLDLLVDTPGTQPLAEECIARLSANVVYDDFKIGGNASLSSSMMGLAFYLLQSTLILSSKHADLNPLGYSAFQIKFYCYTTIGSLAAWVMIAYFDGFGEDDESKISPLFVELDVFFRNITDTGLAYTAEFGEDFPLAVDNTTLLLYQAQGKLEWLWLDKWVLTGTLVPCFILQCVNLFILTRDRSHWGYIAYTMYLQILMLGYFAFLLYLMVISLRASAILIALFIIPVYWLFLLPFLGSVQSGLLPIGLPKQASVGALLLAILIRLIPFALVFSLFIGAGLMVTSTYDDALSDMYSTGILMVSISGLVIGTIVTAGCAICLKAVCVNSVGRAFELLGRKGDQGGGSS